jgi:hypothetical protein
VPGKRRPATHILRDCESTAYIRFRRLGHYFIEQGDHQDAPLSKILHFVWSVGLLRGWKRGGCTIDHWWSRCKGRSRPTPYSFIYLMLHPDFVTLVTKGLLFYCIKHLKQVLLEVYIFRFIFSYRRDCSASVALAQHATLRVTKTRRIFIICTDKRTSTFWRDIVPPSSGSKHKLTK